MTRKRRLIKRILSLAFVIGLFAVLRILALLAHDPELEQLLAEIGFAVVFITFGYLWCQTYDDWKNQRRERTETHDPDARQDPRDHES